MKLIEVKEAPNRTALLWNYYPSSLLAHGYRDHGAIQRYIRDYFPQDLEAHERTDPGFRIISGAILFPGNVNVNCNEEFLSEAEKETLYKGLIQLLELKKGNPEQIHTLSFRKGNVYFDRNILGVLSNGKKPYICRPNKVF